MIFITTKRKKDYKKLDENLTTSNYKTAKTELLNPQIYKKPNEYIGIYAYENKKQVGGTTIIFDYYNWAYIELMWVDENYRNQKLGTALMKQAIQIAKDHKCIGVKLETWDFQARGFYEKLGFKLYGELHNYPQGITHYMLYMDLQ